MSRKKGPKKPFAHTPVTCPHCKAEMDLKIFKDVVVPAIPAEYEFRHELQLLIVPGSGVGRHKSNATKPKKDKPKKDKPRKKKK